MNLHKSLTIILSCKSKRATKRKIKELRDTNQLYKEIEKSLAHYQSLKIRPINKNK